MNGQWDLGYGSGYMDSPRGLEDHRDDFFQLVPPTPNSHITNLRGSGPEQDTAPSSAQYHHLRPTTLKSHRSMSSVGSIDSQQSGYSAISRWSTMTGSDSLPSETDFSRSEARRPSLAIDPKVFQPKSRPSFPDEDEAEEMQTAVPKTARKTKGKPQAQAEKDEKKKISHARKQNPDHVPRPRNAFILFRKYVVDAKLIPASVEVRHQNVSIITAKMWSEAPPDQKAHFNDLARIEKEEHLKKWVPVYRRTNVIRRRVRKDEAEEEKCQSVAELLLRGKSGDALESEMMQQTQQTPEPSGRVKKGRAGQRKSTPAVALSKGALRALRAQARHSESGSVNWSDVSRSNSLERERRGQSASFETPEPDHPPYPHATEGMAYTHSDVVSWQKNGQEGLGAISQQPSQSVPQQTYTYSQQDSSNEIPLDQYSYPQPPFEYFSYDQALPFSPSAQQFQFYVQPPEDNRLRYDVPSDVVFGSYSESLSPTAALFASQPLSARWDRSNQLLLPSSEVPLDALPFDEQDLLLQDFGAALAQADGGSVW
ncbi:hypothetical protein P7C73_g4215, partial [Tremellales sp. Uapishka_1]